MPTLQLRGRQSATSVRKQVGNDHNGNTRLLNETALGYEAFRFRTHAIHFARMHFQDVKIALERVVIFPTLIKYYGTQHLRARDFLLYNVLVLQDLYLNYIL